MNMFPPLSVTLLASVSLFPAPLTQAEPTVRVGGLQIVTPGYGNPYKGGIRAFLQEGTKIALLVETGEGVILAIDGDASKISAVTDEKGADLSSKMKFSFGSFPEKSDDAKAALIEIESKAIPPEGASRITIKGKLSVSIATKMEVFKSAAVKLAKGTPVKAGEYDFTLSEVGKPDFGEAEVAVNLKIKRRINEITAFRFLDAGGTEIEANNSMTSSGGFNQFVTVEKTFDLDKKPGTFVLEVDVWTDAKKIDLPFEVSVGAGFSSVGAGFSSK